LETKPLSTVYLDQTMSDAGSRFGRDDVEVLGTENCHTGFLKLEKLQIRHRLHAGGWSAPLQRELLVKGHAVGVLLFDPDRDELVLVRQFRIGLIAENTNPWMLELVAGMVETGEDGAQVAIRETQEEADCTPENLIRICDYFNSPGTSNEKLTLFCGRVDAGAAGGVHGLTEEHEDIEVIVLPLETAIQAVESGEINNAMSIIAIQWLQLHKSAVLQAWNSPA